MKGLSYEDVAAILNQAVAERGADWTYPTPETCPTCRSGNYFEQEPCDWHYAESCRYFTYQKEPCCIVGYVIDKVVDTSKLNTYVFEGENAQNALFTLQMWEELTLDSRTVELLLVAQQEQDNHKAWGDAVRIAMERTA